MRNGYGRKERDGSELVVIVKDGLVHSEGLSVYPLWCWVDCWWHHKKLAWHVRFRTEVSFSLLISLYPFFSYRSCL
jgi:hypothetical protein